MKKQDIRVEIEYYKQKIKEDPEGKAVYQKELNSLRKQGRGKNEH